MHTKWFDKSGHGQNEDITWFVIPGMTNNDRWASNILSGGCRRSRYPPRLKYWMPIHYDTIEDGQNKKSHLLFSFLVRIVLFLHFIGGIYLSKNIITSFHWFHLNNYTPYENKCFNPRNQIHRVEFVTSVNSVCVQMRHAIRGVYGR